MAIVKYNIGDKVSFRFLGKYEVGVIEEITKESTSFSKYNRKYTINNGIHKLPVGYENIERKIK